jgi:hypothetical protein
LLNSSGAAYFDDMVEAIGGMFASGLPPVGVFSVIDDMVDTKVAKDLGLVVGRRGGYYSSTCDFGKLGLGHRIGSG